MSMQWQTQKYRHGNPTASIRLYFKQDITRIRSRLVKRVRYWLSNSRHMLRLKPGGGEVYYDYPVDSMLTRIVHEVRDLSESRMASLLRHSQCIGVLCYSNDAIGYYGNPFGKAGIFLLQSLMDDPEPWRLSSFRYTPLLTEMGFYLQMRMFLQSHQSEIAGTGWDTSRYVRRQYGSEAMGDVPKSRVLANTAYAIFKGRSVKKMSLAIIHTIRTDSKGMRAGISAVVVERSLNPEDLLETICNVVPTKFVVSSYTQKWLHLPCQFDILLWSPELSSGSDATLRGVGLRKVDLRIDLGIMNMSAPVQCVLLRNGPSWHLATRVRSSRLYACLNKYLPSDMSSSSTCPVR